MPTMGNLHEGHLELCRQAASLAKPFIVSIYVNELQFDDEHDYNRYPRELKKDLKKLEQLTDSPSAVFAPITQDLFFKESLPFTLSFSSPFNQLEGAFRVNYFQGVYIIMMKLMNATKAKHIFMGTKDYQQILLIESIIRHLDFDSCLHRVQTMREKDGLAFSSRNRFLSESDRKKAPFLYHQLQMVAKNNDIDLAKKKLIEQQFTIDYLQIRDVTLANDYSEKKYLNAGDYIVLAAVQLGTVRLIDNLEFTV